MNFVSLKAPIRYVAILGCLLGQSVLATPLGALERVARTPVLIDTDMAPDDWSAILYLLNRADIDVIGITVTGTGEAHCDRAKGNEIGAINALKLIELAGRANENIPVSCGSTAPMRGNHVFPQPWRQNADALFGISLPEPTQKPSGLDAVTLISDLLARSPVKVKILTLGPLTNLGEALTLHPELAANIDSVVIMGGAVNVPGNLADPGSTLVTNSVAEWNIYVDPHAAQIVLQSGASVELIALDGTNDAPVSMPFLSKVESHQNTSSARFIYDYLSKETDFIKSGYFYFWDPLAAAVLTEPDLCQFATESIIIDEGEGVESGRTRIDAQGMPVQVCVKSDREQFEKLFIATVK